MSYRISEYDPEWPNKFAALKKQISEIFGSKALAIEHVGSTSVPGMKAKPIIDVLVLVEDTEALENEKQQISTLGYEIRENIIEPNSLIFVKKEGDEKIENIHVLKEGSAKADQFLTMKEYYVTHPERVKMYKDLKEDLYKKYPNDYLGYRAGKTAFLDETERLAREWKHPNNSSR